jgi:ATP/maltotriose-dependent transcriptional regulator MalT
VNLQFALTYLARTHLLTGEFATAARLIDEDHLIAEATGNPPFQYSAMMLAAWRGDESSVAELAEETMRQTPTGELGIDATFVACARAVVYNGLGQHDLAGNAVEWMFDLLRQDPAHYVLYSTLIMPELAEAAYRTGQPDLVSAVLGRLSERARVAPNDWALGVTARIRAFLANGQEADGWYRESVARLSRTRLRAELARSALLYGEWLRADGRPPEAMEQLRTAYELFTEMGAEAFAARAARGLRASGESVRKRLSDASRRRGGAADDLTSQEAQIAILARDGLSNPEIAARLFISVRTVQYHLGKVFTKLGVSSRRDLHRVLAAKPGPD